MSFRFLSLASWNKSFGFLSRGPRRIHLSQTNTRASLGTPHTSMSSSTRSSRTASVKMTSAAGLGIAGLVASISDPLEDAPVPADAVEKKHHLGNGKGYTNPWDSYVPLTLMGFFRATLWRKLTGQMHRPDGSSHTIPIQTPTFHATRLTPSLRATWLGHACFFLEYPTGLRVLFDPVFEDCCAPVTLSSLKRYTPPPCEIEDLPIVDLVVISHNHYDHLSYPSIKRIVAKFPEARFAVPLGNKVWFESCGIEGEKVVEMDWWEVRKLRFGGKGEDGFEAVVGALPCQHVSARTPFDKCKTLWASWSVESGGKKVYFAGDTGYRTTPRVPTGTTPPHCPAFASVGTLRGPFDLGLIPIGAYSPRWMFSNVHADPEDAVDIFLDTKCKTAIGMHWGTWVLTEEDVMEPVKGLEKACETRGVGKGVFGVVGIGEGREIGGESEEKRA